MKYEITFMVGYQLCVEMVDSIKEKNGRNKKIF